MVSAGHGARAVGSDASVGIGQEPADGCVWFENCGHQLSKHCHNHGHVLGDDRGRKIDSNKAIVKSS